MKTKTIYICETCEKEYTNKKDCLNCKSCDETNNYKNKKNDIIESCIVTKEQICEFLKSKLIIDNFDFEKLEKELRRCYRDDGTLDCDWQETPIEIVDMYFNSDAREESDYGGNDLQITLDECVKSLAGDFNPKIIVEAYEKL